MNRVYDRWEAFHMLLHKGMQAALQKRIAGDTTGNEGYKPTGNLMDLKASSRSYLGQLTIHSGTPGYWGTTPFHLCALTRIDT